MELNFGQLFLDAIFSQVPVVLAMFWNGFLAQPWILVVLLLLVTLSFVPRSRPRARRRSW